MSALAPASAVRLVVICAVALVCAAAVGCAAPAAEPTDVVGDAVQPAPWDLSTPERAVRSYLDWVSFSYRMANSEIPAATMTPEEGVRVDSYIELNRMEGKGIEQALENIQMVVVSEEASSAVVTASESWRYRYFSLDTLEYSSEPLTATYETTYSLVSTPEGWLVDRVEATASDEVQ